MRFSSGALANRATSYGLNESRRYRVCGESGWIGMDPAFAYDNLQAELRACRKRRRLTLPAKKGFRTIA